MRLGVPLFSLVSLGLAVLLYGAPASQNGQQGPKPQTQLSGADLLAEYERLVPINRAIKQGRWPAEHYPRTLGTYSSREVKEAFWCGDVCPQYGFVFLTFSDVNEADCPAIGQPVYGHAWGLPYRGCSPLISRSGTLVEGSHGSWLLAYPSDDYRVKAPVQEPLQFDDATRCSKQGEKVDCGNFQDGQKASVKATKSAGYLAVLRLEM